MTTTSAAPAAPTAAPTPLSDPFSPEWPDTTAHSTRNGPLNRPHRIGLVALLIGTAALYLVGLSKSGWANQFYAAAAQAGSKSWKAFLFGSLDQSNLITVDKPPLSLWPMDLAVRIFGGNSWAILVPQALEGVAAVALLYAAVRRVSTPTAGLLAGAALATTPVATLMFRFDNPDAMLVLLMTAAAYATVRAVQAGRARWLVLAGALVGFAFLTKMLQGLIVVPAFALAYLVAAPIALRRRLLHTLAAGAALIVAAGWWVALVELWPAGARPYIGGSTDNSALQLVFGYNGFGRLTGADNNGSPGGGGGGGGFSSGQTGLLRLFGSEMGTQISWLLPAALLAIVALGWRTARRIRTDALRASVIVWGGWLVVTGLVFSFASGIIHPYYTVALAPAIAALVGLGVVELWRARSRVTARWLLAAMVAATALWTFRLLGRASWHPELRWIVLLTGVLTVLAVLAGRWTHALIVAPLMAVTLLIAPTAYAAQTAATAHTGALPIAGPTAAVFFGGGPGGRGGFGGAGAPRGTTGRPQFGGTPPNAGTFPGGAVPNGSTPNGTRPNGTALGGGTAPTAGRGGNPGGLGGANTVSSALKSALQTNASRYTWVAATTSDNEAASFELATGEPVMSIGGFNGTDNAITLRAFEQLVTQGKIHYYIADGQGFIGSTAANTTSGYAIQQWVEKTFTATTIGGTTVYDLTK